MPQQKEGSTKASALQRVGVGSWDESGNILISKYFPILVLDKESVDSKVLVFANIPNSK